MANYSKNKKYHYTYKTTNLINNRYYLGMHSTNRLDDGYLGSGKRLYYELNKYGRDNFKFEILEQFNSREALVQAEIKLITEEDLKNTNCLNLKSGGSGGAYSKEACRKGGKELGKLHKHRLKTDSEYREKRIKLIKSINKELLQSGKHPFLNKNNRYDWTGKKHRPETINKMKSIHKGKGKGSANSQYGTCWITDENTSKKINKRDDIPPGWRLGRIFKK